MKNTGPLLVALTAAAIVGFGVYAYLDRFKDDAPQSDAAFLAETSDAAKSAPKSAGETNAKLPAVASGTDLPQIEIESDVYDMGLIANNKVAEGSVKIFNRGTAPLEITAIRTECHCTEGEMVDTIIAPGGEGLMKVTLDPFRVPMFVSKKTLTISSTDPRKPEVTVAVKARIAPEISWDPREIDFGKVTKGNPTERTLVIREETAPFSIASVAIAGAKLNSMKTSFAEVPAGERKDPAKAEYKVTITTDGELSSDDYSAQVVLSLAGIKRIPRISIPLKIGITSAYRIDPAMVTLRSVTPGETISGVIKLTSAVPVEVSGFKAGNPAFSVKTRPGDTPNSILFDATLGADATERVQRDTWSFVVNAEGVLFEEKIKVLAIMAEKIDPNAVVPQAPAQDGTTPPAAPAPKTPAPQ